MFAPLWPLPTGIESKVLSASGAAFLLFRFLDPKLLFCSSALIHNAIALLHIGKLGGYGQNLPTP